MLFLGTKRTKHIFSQIGSNIFIRVNSNGLMCWYFLDNTCGDEKSIEFQSAAITECDIRVILLGKADSTLLMMR